MLSDRQMEEVRLFCILIDMLREIMGLTETDHLQVIDDYFQVCQRRASKLSEDIQNFERMLNEILEHQQSMADGVGGLAQEEED